MDGKLRVVAGRWLLWTAVALTLPASTGCVGLVATVLYRGRMAPAACTALNNHRVAVVCTADSGDFGPNPNASLLARRVGQQLAVNVRKAEIIKHQDIEAWLDEHDADFVDYQEIGKGLEADYVVAIEIETLRLQDSATLYKGNAKYRLKVIDVKTGNEIYAPFTPPFAYPKISGLHTASITEPEFRQKFIEMLAADIAVHFYEHDLNDQIAVDPAELPSEH